MTKISIIKSEILENLNGIQHGFFTKTGGVSKGFYCSLNCSHGSKDNPEDVTRNRSRARQALDLNKSVLYGLSQIHSTKVYTITNGMNPEYRRGDALVTSDTGVALSVLGADCAPVLFADPVNRVVAAAHSGWQGAVDGIIAATVDAMLKLGASKKTIVASIGPAISRQSYEVKQDFVKSLQIRSTISTDDYFHEKEGKIFFDLPSFIQAQFKNAGLENVSVLAHDTFTDSEHFFSYRRTTHAAENDYGRQISIISLV